jgi:hypothetical protein
VVVVSRHALRLWVERIKEAEKIDAQFGLYIPGDSALAVVFCAMEEAAYAGDPEFDSRAQVGQEMSSHANVTHTFCMHWRSECEWDRPCSVHELLAENQQLRERISARGEILSRWFAHYPESVFPALSPEQMVKAVDAITETGITSDALHAAWARHLLFHVMSEIKQADAAVGEE